MNARQRGAHVGFDQNSVGHEHLEENNELAENELRTKVSALKSLSIDIGTEIREQNKDWNEIDDKFDSTLSQLFHNIDRVVKLAKSGSRWHMFYLFCFCLFVFFVLWCFI